MDKILTIIVTYNGIKWLEECISSVINSEIPSDIFIVDNGSTDGSIEYIKESFPNVILIESKENLGFGKANNIGLKYALEHKYDYVYLLNQDAWIEPDTLYKLISVSKANPEYGIVSPLQVTKNKTKLDNTFSDHISKEMISASICHQPLKEIYEVKFVMAAHWMITRKCLLAVGGFSPVFPHYGEDNNYLQRLKFHNLKAGIVPTAKGVHDRENRAVTPAKKRYEYYIKNLILFNNPTLNHRFIRFIIYSLSSKNRSSVSLKYLLKSLGGYCKSFSFRRKSKKKCAFLD